MKSILQEDPHTCYLCGRRGGLDKHHVFGGALRKKSERYGLFVWLCHESCHIFGPNSAHGNGDTARMLHERAQRAAMERFGWSREEFREKFYKNYL